MLVTMAKEDDFKTNLSYVGSGQFFTIICYLFYVYVILNYFVAYRQLMLNILVGKKKLCMAKKSIKVQYQNKIY